MSTEETTTQPTPILPPGWSIAIYAGGFIGLSGPNGAMFKFAALPETDLQVMVDRLTGQQPEPAVSGEVQPAAWVGLTDDEIGLGAHNIDPGDWNSLDFRDLWIDGFKAGAYFASDELREKNQPAAPREPLFWYRPRSDVGYERPIHHGSMDPVRKRSGAWVPLYPGEVPAQEGGAA